ncbi:MAG: hypothetical protein ACOYIB_01550 [Desulfosporosinus sp.]|jgi:hypothetical protein
MFYQRKQYHANGFLFILSLLVAFLLGRKSEQYDITIISRGHRHEHKHEHEHEHNKKINEKVDMMDEPDIYPPICPE